MDAARAAVHKITSRVGHTTDVDEVVNPAITRETVKPTRHEEIQTAVDKEVHQDHYHTTVQPLQHREVLPEQHTHNMAAVQNKEFVHGDHEGVKRNVAAEIGQFKDSSVVHDTQHTRSAAPTVAGEHVHHHVHETVQPVIHKETIQPEVVHTTIPIHETHHAAAQHHGMSALPMKSLDEFNRSGGVLSGTQKHTHEEYEGAPRPYNTDLQTSADKVLGSHHTTGTHTSSHHTGAGVGAAGVGAAGVGAAAARHHRSGSISSSDEEKRAKKAGKPSLLDRLNPKKDADGDGKAGVMN